MLRFLFSLTVICFAPMLTAQSHLQQKADKQFELFQYKEAIETYKQVLDKEPDNPDALLKIADSYRMLNFSDEALLWYQKAIRTSNVDPIALFQIGKVLNTLQRYDEARQYFLYYAEAYPTFGNHYAAGTEVAQSLWDEHVNSYDVNLEYINSPFSEFAPALHPEGVVFASSRIDIPRNGDRKRLRVAEGVENQLFVSNIGLNGYLEKPGFYHLPIRHAKNEGPLSFSADGRWVAYTKNNFQNSTRQIPEAGMELSIYIARVDANGNWSDDYSFPYNGSGFSTAFPAFANDGQTLYFASNQADGYGGFDIFVSSRTGNTWSTPVNLGPIINTAGNEISPYYEGGTLYFASDWHFGLGGFDLFESAFENGDWAEVKHMGTAVNSSYDDYGLVYSSAVNKGYFVSNRPDGKGAEDIYHFTAFTDEIDFQVVDAISGDPIEGAVIDFSECGQGHFYTDADGKYSFKALQNLDCEVSIKMDAYATQRFALAKDGVAGDRNFSIRLEKEIDRYLGRVIDPVTNLALQDVTIKGENAQSGHRFETQTNMHGEYSVVMAPQSNYLLTYSKPGYLEMKTRVETGNGSNRSVLKTLSLRPVGMTIEKEEPTDMEKPAAVSISNGYAVQVAAFFNEEKIDLMRYKSLRNLGNVYIFKDKSAKKVRVGIFREKEAAENAQKLIKQQGFNRAFVAAQPVDDQLQQVVIGPPNRQPPHTVPPTEEPTHEGTSNDDEQKTEPDTEIERPTIDIMVQLGAYQNTRYFKGHRVAHLGEIKEFKRGSLSIMLLSGFASVDQAIDARSEARAAGFTGAYLVRKVNDRLIRVRD